MTIDIFDAPADLFLGSDRATALAQGPRRFRSAARALRFAMEQAAPVSLRGASLRIGDRILSPQKIRAAHRRLTLLGQARAVR